MVGKQPHSVEDGVVCPAERPGWKQSNQFEAALASPARRSTRPLRRVVGWAGRERERAVCGRHGPAPASTASWVAVPRSRTTKRQHARARAAYRAEMIQEPP